jgi:transposase-like protein
MKRKKRRRSAGGKHGLRVRAYPAEFRLKVARLFLEEGYSAVLLAGRVVLPGQVHPIVRNFHITFGDYLPISVYSSFHMLQTV